MKNIKKLFLLTFVVLLNTGCSFAPSSYFGAYNVDIKLDESKVKNDVQFKLIFSDLMPRNERNYLIQSINNTLEENARYKDISQTRGQNGLAVAALGGNPLGGGLGGAASLALDVAAKISNATSGEELTYAMLLTKDFVESNKGIKETKQAIREKVVIALEETAKAHHYALECKAYCDKPFRTFELTNILKTKNPDEYRPEKLVIYFMFNEVTKLNSDAILNKLTDGSISHLAHVKINIIEPYSLNDDGSVTYYEGETDNTDQETMSVLSIHSDIFGTPLGRSMYKSLGKQLPNWFYGGDFIGVDYALYQGEIYKLSNLSKQEDFKGTLITN